MYDVLIVGGGPAGVSSAIYLKRANVNVAIIEKSFIGGQIGKSAELVNYAGFVDGDTFEFCENLKTQLKNFDIPVIRDTIIGLDVQNDKNLIGEKGTYQSKAIILCIGADAVKLELPNIEKYEGQGVSYCAICDGNFYKDKVVCVVGGGNSALEDAIYLSKLSKEVHLIHRKDQYRAEKYLVNVMENIANQQNHKIIEHKNKFVSNILGEDKLCAVELTDVVTNEKSIVNTDGLFLCIGRKPNINFLKNVVKITDGGYIAVDENFETNIEGVFAGGDCIEKTLRQVVTAVADGAMISKSVLKYLDEE